MALPLPSIEADPCERYRQLNAIRDKLMTGGTATEVEFENANGTRRRVKYSGGDKAWLNGAIIEARDACQALSGYVRPGRFAIGGRMS